MSSSRPAPLASPAATPARPPATAHEIRAVAVASHRDPRTVHAAYQGRATPVAAAAVADAAVRLGFAPPPEAHR